MQFSFAQSGDDENIEENQLNFYTGFESDRMWNALDINLWTFEVNATNHNYWYKSFHIESSVSECVKGLRLDETVEFPLDVYKVFPNLNAYFASNPDNRFSLQYEHLEKINELQLIDFSSSKIDEIKDDAFKDLKNLKYLYLNDNYLSIIKELLFTFTPKLMTLNLDGNNIEYLSKNVFNPLVNLRKISLALNGLKFLNRDQFQANTKLEYLGLNNNQIEILRSDTFEVIKNIKFIDLSNNVCINETYDESEVEDMKENLVDYC